MTAPIIAPSASIASDVDIGHFTVIHDGVTIAAGSRIGSHCEIGLPTSRVKSDLTIGPNSWIRSHTIIYSGSYFEDRLETGHFVSIREGTTAARNLRVGSYGDVQGDCSFGNFVRLHSNVHIAQGTVIGDLVWMSPRVQLTNDPLPPSTVVLATNIGDMATLATGALLMPGVSIGFAAFVSAASIVREDVGEGAWVAGDPASVVSSTKRLVSFEHGVRFPFGGGFRDRFPTDAQELINTNLKRYRDLVR